MLNNKGFSTAIALILTALILIVMAGLLPAASSMLKMTKIDQDGEIAQAAAEAGAKRVLSELYEDIDDDLTIHDYSEPQRISSNTHSPIYNATYTTIHHSSGANQYTITSTGIYNATQRVVNVDFQAQTKETTYSWNSFMYDEYFFAFAEGKIDLFTGLWGGNIYSNTSVDLLNCIAWDGYIYACPKNNVKTTGWPLYWISMDPLTHGFFTSNDYVNADAKIYNLPDKFIENCRDLTPEWKKYPKDNNVKVVESSTPDTNDTFYLLWNKTLQQGERYYLKGNLVLDRYESKEPIYLTMKVNHPGTVVFFVDGNLTIQNWACIGDYVEQNPNKQILLIVRKDIIVNNNAGLNYVTLISLEGSITFKSNDVNFFGAMQAKKEIIAEPVLLKAGSILKYKRSAIKPFRDIVTTINSPPDKSTPSTFKILKWH